MASTAPSEGFPPLPARRSAASLRGSRASVVTIAVALAANVVVAAAKLAAGLVTGSSAMLAEAIHSTADSINELLLGLSIRRSRRPADREHPFGHGRERFLWALLAATSSFIVGGCFSIALAIRDLTNESAVGHLGVAAIVLAIGAVADGTSLVRT